MGTSRRTGISKNFFLYAIATLLLVIGSLAGSNAIAASTDNMAKGAVAVASSVQGNGNSASAAVDGNLTTHWRSKFYSPQWIYVDLGSSKDLGKVILRWDTAYGKAYQIQVSYDAQTWSTVYSTMTGDGGVDEIALPQGTNGRYVRMYGTVSGIQKGYALWEFEIYGISTVTDTTPPAAPSGLTATAGDSQVTLTWNANSEPDLAGYNLYRNGVKLNSSPLGATTYTDTGLTNGTTYSYQVSAVDTSGNESSLSSAVSATPSSPPTITPTVVNISGHITSNTTWTHDHIYRLTGETTIDSGVVLTVEPGTIVKMNDKVEFYVLGTLNALGTSSSRIVFTSVHDDSVGGDTNGDGSVTSPKPGDWMRMLPWVGGTINLDWATIKYASTGIWYYTPLSPDERFNSNYYAQRLSLTNSELSNNGNGIYILGIKEAIVKNCVIKNNVGDGWDGHAFGMMIVNCISPDFESNQITNNGSPGVDSKAVEIGPNALANFKYNTVSGNVQNAVWLWDDAKSPTDIQNQFSSTGASATLYGGTTYILYGTVWVSKGTTLTIEPGTLIKGEPGALVVQGTLSAPGTSANPIVFTSWRDSSYGGNTTQFTGYVPDVGDWWGLYFDSGSSGTITGALIKYASYGINANSATISISGSNIINNGSGIVNTAGSPVVMAQNNWWGSSSGPILNGFDGVSDNVNFTPWLNSAPF